MLRNSGGPTIPIGPILEHYGASIPTERREWTPMRCPFHGPDRTPSGAVNHRANRFHCFVCMDKSEDAIGVIQVAEGCEYRTALSIAEGIAGPLDGEIRGPSRGASGIAALSF